MPPIKQAAKKAAKKAAAKQDHHKPSRDARRTFEHMGRVQALSSLAASEGESLTLLTRIADLAFQQQQYDESADLLRAAEHLSFAALQARHTESVTAELQQTVVEEVRHLLDRSDEHASEHISSAALERLRSRLQKDAETALKRGSYRAALEFARGAEALSHVEYLEDKSLSAPAPKKELRS